MRALIAMLLAVAGCGEPSSAEHCSSTCAFYSECDPSVAPLESMCVTACNARFEDPKQITSDCSTTAPRHPVDQFRDLPSLRSSVFEAGDCVRERCPAPSETDRCLGVEQICLGTLTADQRCQRTRQIANYNCSNGYQLCIAAGRVQATCASEQVACYQAVDQSCS